MHATTPVNIDRAFLDREYDNVAKVSPSYFRRVIDALDHASRHARTQYDAHLNVPYGPSGLETLDIFCASEKDAPVHVFFHGGYWHALDKASFSYVANGLVPHGVTTVIVNYPLMPAVRMDELVDACCRALAWVHRHLADYRADPGKLSLSGHSAGAHIVAMLLADREGQFPVLPALQGACLFSGIYDLQPIRSSFVNDTLGLSAAEAERNSPMRFRCRQRIPVTIAVGGDEGSEYLRQSGVLLRAWKGSGRDPELTVLRHQNHFSIREQLGDPGSPAIRLVLEQLKRARQGIGTPL
ncbi:MAG: alpha/beta hydrolase [Burkholderiaceae bacterium]